MGGRPPVFTGPIACVGHAAVARDITNFKAGLAQVKAEEGFMTSVAPGTDCGLGGRVHASLAWAKLEALAQGAALASKQLWG